MEYVYNLAMFGFMIEQNESEVYLPIYRNHQQAKCVDLAKKGRCRALAFLLLCADAGTRDRCCSGVVLGAQVSLLAKPRQSGPQTRTLPPCPSYLRPAD